MSIVRQRFETLVVKQDLPANSYVECWIDTLVLRARVHTGAFQGCYIANVVNQGGSAEKGAFVNSVTPARDTDPPAVRQARATLLANVLANVSANVSANTRPSTEPAVDPFDPFDPNLPPLDDPGDIDDLLDLMDDNLDDPNLLDLLDDDLDDLLRPPTAPAPAPVPAFNINTEEEIERFLRQQALENKLAQANSAKRRKWLARALEELPFLYGEEREACKALIRKLQRPVLRM